jgi:hypothetical protein
VKCVCTTYVHLTSYHTKKIKNCIKYQNFPFLFGKYILGLKDPETKIKYEIISENLSLDDRNNKRKAHLHCSDIDQFNQIYNEEYIIQIEKYCSIIITFVNGYPDNNLTNKFTIIKITNKGLDIGAKFICVNYLKDININYDNTKTHNSKIDCVCPKGNELNN